MAAQHRADSPNDWFERSQGDERRIEWNGASSCKVDWIGALGRGGQSIRIVPELDLVVVVTAGYYQDYSPQAFQAQYGVFKDVLQGISPPA
ncbi:hypothetical protein [Bradyrhizobium erythrophlei]|uniref:hypothetical protein n=1 Tax=Bradyrhizobium erythrophlei TaxID=1437360 RepID=UPI000A8E1239|nr:hypothetical protein [Bradyrhizobium erythrophlei]